MVCGQRLTYNYMRIGGVSQDIPEEFLPALEKFIDQMPGFIDEYDRLLKQNEILLARAKGVGILSKETAINCGISGPVPAPAALSGTCARPTPIPSTTASSSIFPPARPATATTATA